MMRTTLRIAVATLATAAAFLSAQSLVFAQALPEYVWDIVAIDETVDQEVQLERQSPTQETDVSPLALLGLGGAKGYFKFPGRESNVRFSHGDSIRFVIRVEDQRTNPNRIIEFARLNVTKKARILPIAKVSAFLLKGEAELQDYFIDYKATKLGSDYFEFRSSSPLPPGEYVVSCGACTEGFLFGVD